MLRKPQLQYNSESQTFKAYRKVRQTNTYKSQLFQNGQNNERHSSRPPNKTIQQNHIFTGEHEDLTPRVRNTDTYRHTDIFSPFREDNQIKNISSRDNSASKSRDNSMNNTEQRNNNVNVNEFLQTKAKKIVPIDDQIIKPLQSISLKKLNIEDSSPCYWQNSVLFPGKAGRCNEQASFSLGYSRQKKLQDQLGNLNRSTTNFSQNMERLSSRSEKKRSSNSVHLDGGLIFPSTILPNQFDSILHRHARLKQNEESSRSLKLQQQGSVSAFKKMMKGKQSSMDKHRFYEGVLKKPESLSKTYKCTSQNKIQAFLNGNIFDVNKKLLWSGTKNVQEGARSNILYGVTEKSPFQPDKEPDVLNFQVSQTDGRFSTNQLKTFCKEQGYGLVKVEEHLNRLSHEPQGTASFTLRVNQFLNSDNNAVERFFKQKGMQCAQENQRQHNYRALLPTDKDTQQQSYRKESYSPAISVNNLRTQIDNLVERSNVQTQIPYTPTNNIQRSESSHGKRSSQINDKKDNANISFQMHLRSNEPQKLRTYSNKLKK